MGREGARSVLPWLPHAVTGSRLWELPSPNSGGLGKVDSGGGEPTRRNSLPLVTTFDTTTREKNGNSCKRKSLQEWRTHQELNLKPSDP